MRRSIWNVKPAASSEKCSTFPSRIVAQAGRKTACGADVRPKPGADLEGPVPWRTASKQEQRHLRTGCSLLYTGAYQHRSRDLWTPWLRPAMVRRVAVLSM